MGHVVGGGAARELDGFDQDGDGGNAVRVIVPVDKNLFTGAHRGMQARGGFLHPTHEEGIVEIGE